MVRCDLSSKVAGPWSFFRGMVVACFVTSGATGLVYEILWGRSLSLLIGGSALAHTIVLSTFMGGLALGNALFGRRADRSASPLALYAWLELGIGALCMLFPTIFAFASEIYLTLARGLGPGSGGLLLIKVCLGVVLLLPAATLMGGTLPVLSRLLVRTSAEIGAGVGALYALNTVGAVAGCVLGGFWIVEALGLDLAMIATAAVNVGVGLISLLLSRSPLAAPQPVAARQEVPAEAQGVDGLDGGSTAEAGGLGVEVAARDLEASVAAQGLEAEIAGQGLEAEVAAQGLEAAVGVEGGPGEERPQGAGRPRAVGARPPGAPLSPRQARAVLGVVAVGGGVTMLYELVWMRLVALVFGSSSQSFSVMLMTFIAGIALGGGIAARALRKERDALLGLAWCQVGVAASVAAAMPIYERFPFVFARLRLLLSDAEGAFALLQALEVAMLFGLMIVPTTLIGMALPLGIRALVRRMEGLGGEVGRVFSINTLGTLVGAALSGAVIIPALGLQASLILGIAASGLLGGIVFAVHGGLSVGSRLKIAGALIALVAGMVLWAGVWDPLALGAGFFQRRDIPVPVTFEDFKASFEGAEVLFHEDGHDTTVVVFDAGQDRFLRVNGKSDASTTRTDMVTQKMLGHLPMLLHPGDPKDVFVIGLGSGVTAGSILLHGAASVRVAELSEPVIKAARLFGDVNHGAMDDPRLTVLHGDARDLLQLDDRRYDAIVSEPSNPWISGVANLFSLEFFQLARARLKDDGLFVQWLQFYALDDAIIARILNTVRAAFPAVQIWRFTSGDLLLVASGAPLAPAPERLERRLSSPSVALDLRADPSLGSPLDLFAHQALSEVALARHFPGRAPLDLDGFPKLEFEAPRALFRAARPRVVEHLDERALPLARSGLMIRALIEARPLDAEALLRLSALVREAEGDSLVSALDEAAISAAGIPRVEPAVATGRLELLLGEHVTSLLAAGSPLEPATCTLFATRLRAHLKATTTVFWQPSPEPFKALVAACAAAHPQSAASLHLALADSLFALALPVEAIEVARRAIDARPVEAQVHKDALRFLVMAHRDLGQEEQAGDYLNQLRKFEAIKPEASPAPR